MMLLMTPAAQGPRPITVNEIVQRMSQHDSWQDLNLLAYHAARRFHAANQRFKTAATMDLNTSFRRPDIVECSICRQ